MKLSITTDSGISSSNRNSYFNSFFNSKFGLDLVDSLREELSIPNLNLELIDENIKGGQYNTCDDIVLSESFARKTGLFKETCSQQICLTKKLQGDFFNPCFELKHRIEKNNDTGEVKKVQFYYLFNEETFLEMWEEAGFPLKWE